MSSRSVGGLPSSVMDHTRKIDDGSLEAGAARSKSHDPIPSEGESTGGSAEAKMSEADVRNSRTEVEREHGGASLPLSDMHPSADGVEAKADFHKADTRNSRAEAESKHAVGEERQGGSDRPVSDMHPSADAMDTKTDFQKDHVQPATEDVIAGDIDLTAAEM